MNKEPESAVAIAPQTVMAPTPDITVTAENADEMAQCQSALILWTRAKLAEVSKEHSELFDAYMHAVKMKWRNDVLKRHAALAMKRRDFYAKMLAALEHGYQIVPNFPITAFAIRTDKKNPLRMMTTSSWSKHEQQAIGLTGGEGEYKNPFPEVWTLEIQGKTDTKPEIKQYYAKAWKDLEFPISMAKPQIMEATTRAMALKIFDDFGILPGAPKQDPMIIARLCLARGTYNRQYLSFIVAWHLDTRVLP